MRLFRDGSVPRCVMRGALMIALALGLTGGALPAVAMPAMAMPALALPVEHPQDALSRTPEAPRWRLTTDIVSENAMIALAHDATATPVNHRLDVAYVRYERRIGAPDPRGNLRVALDFQHGGLMTPDGSDFVSRPTDHYSFTITREIYLGASVALPLRADTALVLGGGALRTEMRDNFATGDATRDRDRTLQGWRLSLGAEKRIPAGVLRAEYRLARESDAQRGTMSLDGQARGRLMLSLMMRFD